MTTSYDMPRQRLGWLLAAAVVILAASCATPAQADTQTIPATADTWARQRSEQNSPHGSQTTMKVRGGSGIDENRAYVSFDLTRLSVPAASTNITARLLLRVQRYDYTGQALNASFVRKITGAWSEDTLTWSNQPAIATPEQPMSMRTPVGSDATADVTPLLPSVLTGTLGLRIAEHYGQGGQQAWWATKEDTTGPSARLEVSYTPKATIAAAYRAQVASRQGAWQNINGSPIWHSGPAPCREPVRNIKRPGTGGEFTALSEKWTSVPLPCNFTPTAGSPDQEVVLINDTGVGYDYFEFWEMRNACRYTDGTESVGRTPDPTKTAVFCGFMADWGGAENQSSLLHLWPNTTTWPHPGGVYEGTRGSKLTEVPGLVTAQELYDGAITHPVQVTVAWACGTYVSPATSSDGSDSANCIPYGSVIKLPASANCAGYAYVTRLVCEAGKQYGLIAVDQNQDRISIAFEGYTRPGAWWRPDAGVYNPYSTPPFVLKRDGKCTDPANPWALESDAPARDVVQCFANSTDPSVPAGSATQIAINALRASADVTPGPGKIDFFGCDGLQGTGLWDTLHKTTGYPVLAGDWEQDCTMGLHWEQLLNRADWYDANG